MKTGPKPVPIYKRVMRRVVRGGGDCWIWTGSVDGGGYGQIRERHGAAIQITHKTHRVVYEHRVAPIPEGHDLHHLCGTRACCNPDHLEPIGHADHTRHHWAAMRGVC